MAILSGGIMNPTTIDKGLWPGWTYKTTGDDRAKHFEYFAPGSQPGAPKKQSLGDEYLGKYNAFSNPVAGQTEGGAAQGFFYNPSGRQGDFHALTSAALDDPNVYKSVRDRYIQFGNDPAWLGQLNTASEKAKKGFEGSSFTLTPEVLKKMWSPKK